MRNFFISKAVVHSHHIHRIGRTLRGPRDIGFLIASHRIAGYLASEPSAPTDGTLWGFPDHRVARPRGHAQPHPRIARYAADAGCSTCFSGDAGLAAAELFESLGVSAIQGVPNLPERCPSRDLAKSFPLAGFFPMGESESGSEESG
jgi:hypothetical protein